MKTSKIFTAIIFLLIAVCSYAQPSVQWSYRFNGEGDYSDRFTSIVSDANGNIYAAGSTVNIGTDRDYLVQKMDASGNLLWRVMYNAAGNGPDEVTALAVDPSGNVYVTGFGKSENVGNDFLTIKYNMDGNLVWAQDYNYETANAYDQANSITLDAGGNVIVTGQSDNDASSVTNDDYLTLKYSSSGNLLWNKRYNGLGNGTDRAVKVVTDNSNNIYITGRSYNGNDDDYTTIKYDANGSQLWIKFGDRTHTDRATAMVIDASANVYVTGWSSNGTNDDFYTIKYSSDGVQSWAKVYDFVDQDRVFAIAVDVSGNSYITGQSDGDSGPFVNLNFRTIKYNSSGVQQWVAAYDGTAGNDDIPTGILSTSDGNVVVTGYSDSDPTPVVSNNLVTINYSSTGVNQWTNIYEGAGGFDDVGNAVVLGSSNNIYIAGYEEDNHQQRNALLLEYSLSGTTLSSSSFNGMGDNSDNVHDVKVDNQGNIYLAGYTVQRGNNRDFFTIKLTSSGDTLWTRFLNGTSPDSEDEGQAASIDDQGNVIVSGFTKNSGTSGDYTTVKFNAVGDSLWLRYFDSPTHENDKVYDMQSDASGNIYLTGRTDSDQGITSNDDATTIKYSADGIMLWMNSYNGTANGADRGSFIRVSPSGNVYVAGRTFTGVSDDILLIKYDNSGSLLWTRTVDGGFGNDEVNGVVIDEAENIYFTGNSAGPADSADFITAKFSAGGDQLWLKRYNGIGSGGDFGEAIALDLSGNILVTGYSDGDNSPNVNFDLVTIKYDMNGNEVWKAIHNGTNNLDDIADGIITDSFGNCYVSGHTNNGSASDVNYDMLTIQYSAAGTENWNAVFNGPSDTLDIPNKMILSNGNLFIAGSSWQEGQQRDIILIKYADVTGIASEQIMKNLSGVYPNPFTNYLQLDMGILTNNEMQFELINLNGAIIFSTSVPASGKILFRDPIPAGAYLYRLTSKNVPVQYGKLIQGQ